MDNLRIAVTQNIDKPLPNAYASFYFSKKRTFFILSKNGTVANNFFINNNSNFPIGWKFGIQHALSPNSNSSIRRRQGCKQGYLFHEASK